MQTSDAEKVACSLARLRPENFNPRAEIPYGCTAEHIRAAMNDFLDFLEFINTQINTKQIPRLETCLMPANFNSIVGEVMSARVPKHCKMLAKNKYHIGQPDIVPIGLTLVECFEDEHFDRRVKHRVDGGGRARTSRVQRRSPHGAGRDVPGDADVLRSGPRGRSRNRRRCRQMRPSGFAREIYPLQSALGFVMMLTILSV